MAGVSCRSGVLAAILGRCGHHGIGPGAGLLHGVPMFDACFGQVLGTDESERQAA